MTTTSSTLTTILNTVAPPISAHETLELWLSHPMVGYAGVEGVVYRAWTRILEQTESGELIVVWSPSPRSADQPGEQEKRSINPLAGWEKGWERASGEMESVKGREEKDPQGRNRSSSRQSSSNPVFVAQVGNARADFRGTPYKKTNSHDASDHYSHLSPPPTHTCPSFYTRTAHPPKLVLGTYYVIPRTSLLPHDPP